MLRHQLPNVQNIWLPTDIPNTDKPSTRTVIKFRCLALKKERKFMGYNQAEDGTELLNQLCDMRITKWLTIPGLSWYIETTVLEVGDKYNKFNFDNTRNQHLHDKFS